MSKTAVLFDLDGVVCQSGEALEAFIRAHENLTTLDDRWALWWETIHEHPVDPGWLAVVRMAIATGTHVIMLTARPEEVRGVTEMWLADNDVPFDRLLMREPYSYHLCKLHHTRALQRMGYQITLAVDDDAVHIRHYEELKIPTIHVAGLLSNPDDPERVP